MIVVNMPGGAIQVIAKPDLLWLRKAFDSEWKGGEHVAACGRTYLFDRIGE